jgi:hypothetical protein
LLRPFFVIGVLSTATGALADPVPLANDELKKTVAGSTVEIDTPLGSTVPMRFGTDGLVSAEAGVLAPVLGSAKDRGRWWVDGDKLCTKWFRWFDAGVRCLTIARDGARIHWRKIDDGETGTGTLVNWTPPGEKKATVVAKADAPPPAKKPEPESEKRGTKLAVPPRDVPEPPPAPEAPPTVVARADPNPAAEDAFGGEPAMRFGGAGLLGASALAAPEVKAADPAPTPQAEKLPDPQRPVAKLPAKDAKKKDVAASAKAAKKAPVQRQASLQAVAPAKTAPQRRPPPREDWEGVNVATSAASPAGLYRVRGVADYDVLNVRRGPSEEHVSIASIPPTGRRVEIIGQCRADWCPIRYGGITGWVNSYYLAEDGSRQGSASPVYRQR